MFTGIIEEMGVVQMLRQSNTGVQVIIRASKTLRGLKRGGSIAVNGVCLTATEISKTQFAADLSQETLSVTDLGNLKSGDRVNLERAISLNRLIEGHLVLGHVEGIGQIRNRKEDRATLYLTVSVPATLLKYCIPKGSIAVDGVSLTIQSLHPRGITVAIIPHTATVTTLGVKQVGDAVNLETDFLAKYVERLMKHQGPPSHYKGSVPSSTRGTVRPKRRTPKTPIS